MSIRLLSSGIPDLVPMKSRTKGVLHHSTVLSDYCVRMGHYDKSEMDMTRLQLGCALEETIAIRYNQSDPDRYIQPGELLLGDMPITPDLLDTRFGCPEEIKLSWLSSRHTPDSEKFQRFWWQIMGQCCALGYLRIGNLNITHIRGDYKGIDVHHNLWQREFSKSELLSYESMILRHRDRMIREGHQGEE
jgi:hypothetical protein